MSRVLILLAALLASQSGAAIAQNSETSMAEDPLAPRPVCAGRHIVDIPAASWPPKVDGGFDRFKFNAHGPATQAQLDAHVAERIKLAKAGGEMEEHGVSENEFRFVEQRDGITVLAYEEITFPAFAGKNFDAETWFLSGGRMFSITGFKAYEDKDSYIADMFRLAANTRPRAIDEIPEEEGFCTDGAFVATPPMPHEIAQLHFGLSEIGFGVSLDIASTVVDSGYKFLEPSWAHQGSPKSALGIEGLQRLAEIDINSPYAKLQYFFQAARQPTVQVRGIEIQAELTKGGTSRYPQETGDIAFHVWNMMLDSIRPTAGNQR